MGDPLLVLLRVQATLFDDADPNVDDVAINNRVPCGIGVGCAREVAEGKGVKAVVKMPVSGHPLAKYIAIFLCPHTVVLREPLKHVNEDNVWFTKALLLEGGVYPNHNGAEENIGEGSIHGDDVSPCFLVKGMSCTSCSVVIFVGTTGIVRYFIHKWNWCEGVRICIRSEEPVDGHGGYAQNKRRFIVLEAGEQCIWVWAHRHMWNSSSIRDSSVGISWIGSGKKGNPAFVAPREVSIAGDMVIGM